MKKKEEYVPQFDYEDEPQKNAKVCSQCNERTLTLYDNLCFDCKKKIGFSDDMIDTSFGPNESIYNSYIEKNIEKNTTPFALGIIWKPLRKYGITLIICLNAISIFIESIEAKSFTVTIFSVFLFVIGILILIFRKKQRHKKFNKYNEMFVEYLEKYGWICPSCGEINYTLKHCEFCGVRPQLVINKDVK